jgi:hypothetical protein
MTREQLNRLVVRADTNNYITNPNHLLTGPLGHYEPRPSTVMWATDRAWNGWAFECFLCHSTFATLVDLNKHLQSPRHEEKIYRCPKSTSSLGRSAGCVSMLRAGRLECGCLDKFTT